MFQSLITCFFFFFKLTIPPPAENNSRPHHVFTNSIRTCLTTMGSVSLSQPPCHTIIAQCLEFVKQLPPSSKSSIFIQINL